MSGGHSEHHPLHHPEQIDRGQNDAQCGEGGGDLAPQKRSSQDEKLPHKAVCSGQSQRGEGENHQAGGEAGHGACQANVIYDQPAVGAFVNHSHAEKECSCRDAMVDHLHDCAFDALRVQDKNSQCHKSHVTDARIGDQLFDIGLRQCHVRSIDDRDDRQGNHEFGKCDRGIGQHGKRKSEKSIRSHFKKDTGQDDAAGGRCLHVRIRQPGVQREHGDLDGEGGKEGPEEERLQGCAVCSPAQSQDIERVAAVEIQHQNGDQQQHAARQGIEEKFDRRIESVRTAPHPDQQIHGDEHGFPKDIEQDKVQGGKHTEHRRFHHKKHGHKPLHPTCNGGP